VKKVNDNYDEGLDLAFDKKYPAIATEVDGRYTTTIYILRGIEAPEEFVEVLAVMAAAQEGDTITFKFNTSGGRLDSTLMLMDAMESCKAVLVGEIVGEVASAGTMLAMKMDHLRAAKWGSMMIHNYSGGMYGKGGEQKVQAEFSLPFLERFFHDVYKDFLTKKERKKVIKDQDMYLDAQDIEERFEKVLTKRQERVTKKVEELNKAAIKQGIEEAFAFLDEHSDEVEEL